MDKKEILSKFKNGLIVSCQALENEPLYCEEMSLMPFMALAAKQAGAVGIRANSVRDVKAIKEKVNLPLIGLIKKQYGEFPQYITVTMKEIDELIKAGADIIALDCTLRERIDGLSINEFIKKIKEKYPSILLMADIATYEEGINAYNAGVDFVGTTLNGYTAESEKIGESNFDLVSKLSKNIDIPVIAEGKVHTPDQAKQMLDLGAYAVVVGGAITRPLEIATRFVEKIKNN